MTWLKEIAEFYNCEPLQLLADYQGTFTERLAQCLLDYGYGYMNATPGTAHDNTPRKAF